jgi:hypothetical protein
MCYERIEVTFARINTGIGVGYITSVTPIQQLNKEVGKFVAKQSPCFFGLTLASWVHKLIVEFSFI